MRLDGMGGFNVIGSDGGFSHISSDGAGGFSSFDSDIDSSILDGLF